MAEQEYAINRVASYPLVRDSWSKLSEVYQRGKDGSRILRFCGGLAESSAMMAFNASQPVLSKLPVETVNNLAVQTLDGMEQKYPMLTKPTDEMVDSVKSYSCSVVEDAKSYGVTQFNRLADATKLTLVLDIADSTVDKLLPADEEAIGENPVAIDLPTPPCSPSSPIATDASSKLRLISSKVRQRAYQRAMSKVKGLEKRSVDAVEALMHTVNLIDYAKQNLGSLSYEKTRDKINEIYADIVAEETETEPQTLDDDMTVERKAIFAARRLALRAHSTFTAASRFASVLPERARTQLNEAVMYTDSLYQSLIKVDSYKAFSAQLVSQLREKLAYLESVAGTLTSTIAESSPLNWLASHLPESKFFNSPTNDRHLNKLENDSLPPSKKVPTPEIVAPQSNRPEEIPRVFSPDDKGLESSSKAQERSVDGLNEQPVEEWRDERVVRSYLEDEPVVRSYLEDEPVVRSYLEDDKSDYDSDESQLDTTAIADEPYLD